MWTITLLIVSNLFMTFAWYGHLKYKDSPMVWVILISWGIAFFEYCFQVPANRIGHQVLGPDGVPVPGSGPFNAAQLKTIQEIITLAVFCVFSITFLKEPIKWNVMVGFGFLVLAAFFIFKKW